MSLVILRDTCFFLKICHYITCRALDVFLCTLNRRNSMSSHLKIRKRFYENSIPKHNFDDYFLLKRLALNVSHKWENKTKRIIATVIVLRFSQTRSIADSKKSEIKTLTITSCNARHFLTCTRNYERRIQQKIGTRLPKVECPEEGSTSFRNGFRRRTLKTFFREFKRE